MTSQRWPKRGAMRWLPVLLLAGGVVVWYCSGSTTTPTAQAVPTPAGFVFSEPGVYTSPRGSHRVRVWLTTAGRLQHTVESEQGTIAPHDTFSARSEWMMCWDENEQLWFYQPEELPAYCTCYYLTETEIGTRTCGELGGWQGIPQPFLDRLPAAARATWEQAQQYELTRSHDIR